MRQVYQMIQPLDKIAADAAPPADPRLANVYYEPTRNLFGAVGGDSGSKFIRENPGVAEWAIPFVGGTAATLLYNGVRNAFSSDKDRKTSMWDVLLPFGLVTGGLWAANKIMSPEAKLLISLRGKSDAEKADILRRNGYGPEAAAYLTNLVEEKGEGGAWWHVATNPSELRKFQTNNTQANNGQANNGQGNNGQVNSGQTPQNTETAPAPAPAATTTSTAAAPAGQAPQVTSKYTPGTLGHFVDTLTPQQRQWVLDRANNDQQLAGLRGLEPGQKQPFESMDQVFDLFEETNKFIDGYNKLRPTKKRRARLPGRTTQITDPSVQTFANGFTGEDPHGVKKAFTEYTGSYKNPAAQPPTKPQPQPQPPVEPQPKVAPPVNPAASGGNPAAGTPQTPVKPKTSAPGR